jgi:hypothetical protein
MSDNIHLVDKLMCSNCHITNNKFVPPSPVVKAA